MAIFNREKDNWSDDQILARLRSRDPAAMALVYDRYALQVYNTAQRVLHVSKGDLGEAGEVVQEVMLLLWRDPDNLEKKRQPCPPENRANLDLGWWMTYAARDAAVFHVYKQSQRRPQPPPAFKPLRYTAWPLRYKALLEIDKDSPAARKDVDAVFRTLLANVGAGNVVPIAPYD